MHQGDPNMSCREAQRRMRTQMIHGRSYTDKWDYDHHVVPPITASATFRLDSAARGARGFSEFAHTDPQHAPPHPIYIYDRLDEPTRGMLEDNLARAERGDCALCFASGMSAISAAVATLLGAGRNVVAHRILYGCTYSLFTTWLPRFGMQARLVDLTDPRSILAAVDADTRVIYFETPVNPDLTLIDIGAVRRVVDEMNEDRAPEERIRIVVDNTFATPCCQRPLELGADVVCQSLTKGIGGFGTDVGGAVIGPNALHDELILYRKDWGGSLSPKAAWHTLVYGLPTLATRMTNYQKSAHYVAEFLEQHPQVQEVHYPGLDSFPQRELAMRQMRDENGNFAPGSMVYFVLRGETEDGARGAALMDWVARESYCITLAVSLGQIKTLIECPYSMTHAAVPAEVKIERGVRPGGIRLSVGLEDRHDIVADLSAALSAK